MKRIALVVSALVSALGAAEIPDMPAEYRADPKAVVAAANAATSARFPDADRVMVDDRIHVAYQSDGSEITWDDEWQKVLTEKGRRAASTVTLDFTERYGDAQIFSVEIVGTNGQVRAVDFARTLKVATDNSSLGSNIVDPLDKQMSCTVSGLAVGEIRHVRFARRTRKARMAGTWADMQLFEYTAPILSTVYTVDQPDANPVRHAVVRHPFGKTVVRSPDRPLAPGRTLLRWDVRDVPQAFPEPNMPPLSTCVQAIRLSTAKDWPTISRWYWSICAPHLAATTPEMTNEVRRLVAGCATEEAKLRAVFKFVSQEIRYMGLTLEDGAPGYEPHDVDITFRNRYGVCRDKAALLAVLLRIAGIRAYPVLIHVGAKMDAEVPWPFFNHAVVAVEEGPHRYRLMDPTDESTHDLLPSYLSDRSYLVAHPAGETLRTSPVQPVRDNLMKLASEGTLSADGSLLLTTEFAFAGINDTALRHSLLKRTPDERRRAFESFIRGAAAGAELLSFELTPSDLRDTDTPLSAKTVARVPNAVVRGKTRDELALPLITRNLSVADALLSENTALERRRFPLRISTTAGTEETLRIVLGDAVGAPASLPPACSIGTNGYAFALACAVTNGTLRASRTMYVKDVNFDVPAYDALRNDRKETESAERAEPSFASRDDDGAHVRWIDDRSVTHFTSPTSWVTTNTFVKEVLTYKGKKGAAEMSYTYSPATRCIEVVEATVSNRNGTVSRLTPKEVNLLDANWVASAPRYPASKKLMVNLPGVEVGSVIRATVVKTVTNAPVAYTGVFTFDSVDPVDRVEVEMHVPKGMRFKLKQKSLRDLGTNGVHRWMVKNPKRVPNEPLQPGATSWRAYASVSAADWREHGRALLDALARARAAGSGEVRRAAREAVKHCHTPQERITAIRTFLAHRLRVAGPGLFELPFDIAFSAPDRALADGYASGADRMNLLFAMLDAAGFDPSFVLATSNAHSTKPTEAARRALPRPETFGSLIVRVEAEGRTFWVGGENEYTPPEASSYAGCTFYDPVRDEFGTVNTPKTVAPPSSWWAPWTWFASAPPPPTNFTWHAAAEYFCRMTVRENGAVDFDVESRSFGAGVGEFRKRFTEMLPELRNRYYQQLVGKLAQNATATSEFVTDVKGYPAKWTFSAYAPEFAVVRDGRISVRIPDPDFESRLFALDGSARKSPILISGKSWSIDEYEIVFPKGYTKMEHLPTALTLRNPSDSKDVWLTHTATSRMKDGCLVVTVKRRVYRAKATTLTADYAPFLQEWNRRATSLDARTVTVRKGK